MRRRAFLKVAATFPAAITAARIPGVSRASAAERTFDPRPGPWRTYEMTTRVEVVQPKGTSRVWVPIPTVTSDFQSPIANEWSGSAKLMKQVTDPKSGATMLYAEFPDGTAAPVIEVVSRFRTRSRAIDWSRKVAARESADTLRAFTQPTEFLPTDGIVRETAVGITQGKSSDVEKVRAIYEWTLANTYREPKVRGCGVGDIKTMLETRAFGGKCADINALFVGLARSVGIPARDLYGIRVAKSEFGYKALGAGPNVTKAQHCRAEAYLADHGWVAMDPADVLKVAREETSDWLKIDDPVVAPVRPKLFGGWEGNWVALNMAHDVSLPNSANAERIAFLMYPQCETADGLRDSLDPDNFRYTITSREISA